MININMVIVILSIVTVPTAVIVYRIVRKNKNNPHDEKNRLIDRVNNEFKTIKDNRKLFVDVERAIKEAQELKYKSLSAIELIHKADNIVSTSKGNFENIDSLIKKVEKGVIKNKNGSLKKALKYMIEIRELIKRPKEKFQQAESAVMKAREEEYKLNYIIKNVTNKISNITQIVIYNQELIETISKTMHRSIEAEKIIDNSERYIKEAVDKLDELRNLNSEIDTKKTEKDANLIDGQVDDIIESVKQIVERAKKCIREAREEEDDLDILLNKAKMIRSSRIKLEESIISELKECNDILYREDMAIKEMARMFSCVKEANTAIENLKKHILETKNAKSSKEVQIGVDNAMVYLEIVEKRTEEIRGLCKTINGMEQRFFDERQRITGMITILNSNINKAKAYMGDIDKIINRSNDIDREKDIFHKAYIEMSGVANEIKEIEKKVSKVKYTQSVQVNGEKIKTLMFKITHQLTTLTKAYEAIIKEDNNIKIDEQANNGTSQDKYANAVRYKESGNTKQYMYWLDKSSVSGYKKAQKELGLIYLGRINAINDANDREDIRSRAILLFKELAESGESEIQFYLGHLYMCSDDNQDINQAMYWLEKASNSGNIDATGYLFLSDRLNDKSFSKTFELMKREADKNKSYIAMICVGIVYMFGKQIPRNSNLANDYITRGNKGHNIGLPYYLSFNIGKRLYDDQEFAFAKIFLSIAAKNGDLIAKEYLEDSIKMVEEYLKKNREVEIRGIRKDKIDSDIEKYIAEVNDLSHKIDDKKQFERWSEERQKEETIKYNEACKLPDFVSHPLKEQALENINRYIAGISEARNNIRDWNKRIDDLKREMRELERERSKL